MMKKQDKKACVAVVATACALSLTALTGCQPQEGAAGNEGNVYATDAYAYEGEYAAYDPEATADVTGGVAIEGSEEEELQQERIAGGAVGAVVSKNLEPLVGMTDYSEGEYSGDMGMYGQPPARHGIDTGCIDCHDPRTADVPDDTLFNSMPKSHVDSNLSEEDCLSCHQDK